MYINFHVYTRSAFIYFSLFVIFSLLLLFYMYEHVSNINGLVNGNISNTFNEKNEKNEKNDYLHV